MLKKLLLLFVFIFLISAEIYSKDELTVPEKVILLSLSMSESDSIQTVIDLSDNEIVLLNNTTAGYKVKLLQVVRTGMIVDLSKQIEISNLLKNNIVK